MRSKPALTTLASVFLLAVLATPALAQGRSGSPAFSVVGSVVLNLLLYLGGGALLVFLAPDTTESVVRRARDDPLVSGVAGIGSILLVAVATFVLAITVVGLIVAIPLAIVFTIVEIGGYVFGAVIVGTVLVDAVGDASHGIGLVVGTVLVTILSLIPILGGIVLFVVNMVGLGSLVLHLKSGYYDGGGRPDPTGAV